MRIARRGVLGALPLLGAPIPSGWAACVPVAEVPLRSVEGYALVPATVAGAAVLLVLDTGAQGMLIEPEVAASLGLPLRGMTRIFGTGGSQAARLVLVPGLRLGDAAMPEQVAPVAPLPIALRTQPVLAGLLGASLLSRFDVLIDVPGARVCLFLPGECGAPFAGVRMAMEVSRAGEAYVPVRVNGARLLALVDTGSRATLLTLAAARRLGLDMPVSANTAPGIDGERLPVGHIRVRMAVGDGPAAESPVSVAPLQLDRGDMLLGLDQVGRQPVWISYGRGEIVFGRPAP